MTRLTEQEAECMRRTYEDHISVLLSERETLVAAVEAARAALQALDEWDAYVGDHVVDEDCQACAQEQVLSARWESTTEALREALEAEEKWPG